jgi:hypothetical protein
MRLRRRPLGSSLLPVLSLVTLACGGGGGGGGEAFAVAGLWSVAGIGAPGTPNPDSDACRAAADAAGRLPATTLDVVEQGDSLTATEVGSGLAFTGTTDDANQSFNLNSTTPMCQTAGSCTVCGAVGVNFLNADGNTADVNVAFVASGNSACPGQCTVTFQSTGKRS